LDNPEHNADKDGRAYGINQPAVNRQK